MNIVNRSYSDLLKPLDYVQSAPIGFLFIEKFFMNILGNNEYALRLFSVITGILAIIILYRSLKYFNDFKIEVFALSFFVFNDHLIYFSSEVKPYSNDVFLGLILLTLALIIIRNGCRTRDIIIWGLLGTFTIWFSFPSVFVFAGSGIAILFYIIKLKNYKALRIILFMGGVWSLSLIFNYSICLRHYTTHRELLGFWQNTFIPCPPKSIKEMYQIVYAFARIFKNPGGFSIYELLFAILLFFVGVAFLWNQKRQYCLIILMPLLITILGSGLQLYPFEGRVLLFITAILIVFVSAGLSRIYEILKKESRAIAILVSLIFFIHPAMTAGIHLLRPRAPEELRPVLEYVSKNKKQEDIIYVYYGAVNAFTYYQKRFPDLDNRYITGIESRTDWTGYYRDIERLKGYSRVWFVFSHIATHLGVNEEKLFLNYLNLHGMRIDSFNTSGASAYLYELNK